MSLGIAPTTPEAVGLPADRLFRMGEDQFRRAVAIGLFDPAERVELVDGLVRLAPDGTLYRFRLDQYCRMDEGIFRRDDRVELFGGWVVVRPRMLPPHRRSTWKVRVALERVIPAGWYVDQQSDVSMPFTDSQPQPDVQVTRGSIDDYVDRHPGPGDLGLLVEVSDSTLWEDRGFQKRLYAAEGVPIYWIVNLRDRRVEVYTDPTGPADAPDYRSRADYGPEDEIPVVLDGREVGRVAVREVLP